MLYNVSHRGLTPAPAGPGPRPSVVSTEVQGSGVGVGGVNVHFILLGFHYGLHHRHCGGRRQRALRLRSGVSLTRSPLGVGGGPHGLHQSILYALMGQALTRSFLYHSWEISVVLSIVSGLYAASRCWLNSVPLAVCAAAVPTVLRRHGSRSTLRTCSSCRISPAGRVPGLVGQSRGSHVLPRVGLPGLRGAGWAAGSRRVVQVARPAGTCREWQGAHVQGNPNKKITIL